MKYLIAIILGFCLLLTSCKSEKAKITEDGNVSIPTATNADSIFIFDIKSSRNSVDFFIKLANSSFIKVEDPVIEDNQVKNAIVFFNRTGFGATVMYDEDGNFSAVHLISTKQDDENYEQVKDAIMYFYGEKEDDEWHTCRWLTDSLQIDLRPLHTDEGGTVMMWMF